MYLTKKHLYSVSVSVLISVLISIFMVILIQTRLALAVDYELIESGQVTQQVLESSAKLFSNHYGKWGNQGIRPGRSVSLNAQKLQDEFIFDEKCGIARATVPIENGKEQIGHAIFRRFHVKEIGEVFWITQLVVHSSYRHQGIAKTLIRSILQNQRENQYAAQYGACGLVSSHPYAIRALEKATQLTCHRQTIVQQAQVLKDNCEVGYVEGKTFDGTNGACRINTGFFVDHTELLRILEQENRANFNPWQLGNLPEGYEFFAFVFPENS